MRAHMAHTRVGTHHGILPALSAGAGFADRTGDVALLATVLSLDVAAGGGIAASDAAALVLVHNAVTVAVFLRIVGVTLSGVRVRILRACPELGKRGDEGAYQHEI